MKAVDQIELVATFLTLCEEESLRKAGKRLGISGTAVGNRVRQLQEQVGVPLVNIEPRGDVNLTPAGQRLRDRCAPTGRLLRSAWAAAIEEHSQPRLTVASTGVGIRFRLPAILEIWRQKGRGEYDAIPVEIRRIKSSEIPGSVLAGEVTFGLGRRPDPGQDHEVLNRREYEGSRTVIAHARSLDARLSGPATAADINERLGWVMPQGSETGMRILREVLALPSGKEPNVTHWVGNYEDAALFAARGFAATLTVEPFVAAHRSSLAPLLYPDTANPDDSRFPGALIWRNDLGRLTGWQEHFLEAFEEHKPTWEEGEHAAP